MLKKKDNIEHKINKFYEFKKKRIMFLFDLKTDNEFKIFLKKYNIVYDYYKSNNLVKINDIKRVIRFTKNIPKKIEFKSLTHYNNNYNNGILPTLYKLSALSYNSNFIKKDSLIYQYLLKKNDKYIILFIKDTLLILLRGSKYFNEIKRAMSVSKRTKYIFDNKETHEKFLNWKSDFLKKFKKLNNNTDVPKIKHKNLYVHKEYYNKSNIILKDLKKIINTFLGKGLKNIILTGHSMGGSLSMICGIKLKELYRDKLKINIISFSNLAVGNRNLSLFAIYLGLDSYIRVYNGSDLVDKYRSGIVFKFHGRLRHLNHSFTKKYINHYIREDIDKYIPKKLIEDIKTKKKYKKLYLNHVLYRFSKNKNAPIFI